MSETPETLDALIRVPAPSGYETPAAEVWREAASFGEVAADVLGSSTVAVGVADDRPTVAIVGHIDEIGLFVSHIDDEGFVWFGPIGGWDPQNLVGQRVDRPRPRRRGLGRDRQEADPPARARRPQEAGRDQGDAHRHRRQGQGRRAEARQRRRPRRPRRRAAEPPERPPRLALARQPARLLRRARGRPPDQRRRAMCRSASSAAPSRRRRSACSARRPPRFSLDPDIGIAVDVTHATDAPGISKQENGDHALGSGPVIGRGSTLNPMVSDAAPRHRGGRGDRLHARGLGPLHRHRRRLAPDLARRHRRRARLDPAPLHALDRRDDLARRRRGHDPPARGLHPPPRPRGVVPALAGGDASRKLSAPRRRRAPAGGTPRPAR